MKKTCLILLSLMLLVSSPAFAQDDTETTEKTEATPKDGKKDDAKKKDKKDRRGCHLPLSPQTKKKHQGN